MTFGPESAVLVGVSVVPMARTTSGRLGTFIVGGADAGWIVWRTGGLVMTAGAGSTGFVERCALPITVGLMGASTTACGATLSGDVTTETSSVGSRGARSRPGASGITTAAVGSTTAGAAGATGATVLTRATGAAATTGAGASGAGAAASATASVSAASVAAAAFFVVRFGAFFAAAPPSASAGRASTLAAVSTAVTAPPLEPNHSRIVAARPIETVLDAVLAWSIPSLSHLVLMSFQSTPRSLAS